MSAMTESIRITPKDLGTIPRRTAEIVCDLVNNYGVRHRLQKGAGHLFLYNGSQQERPYKISASRPEETTLSFLMKWIDQNVPEYGNRKEVTPADLDRLRAVVSTTEPRREVPPPVDPEPEEGWEPAPYGFETNGETFRCAEPGCGYSKRDKHGLHLHARTHGNEMKAQVQKSVSNRSLAMQQRKVIAQEALRVLAEQNGLVVFEKGEAPSTREIDKARAAQFKAEEKAARLEQELADTKARLALITEALKA